MCCDQGLHGTQQQEVWSGVPDEVVSHDMLDKTAEREALLTQPEAAA